MNKVLAVTVGMSTLFVGPAYAECSADDLITPIVPVATGYDTNGALGGSWTVIDTFKQNQDTVCINQSQTENFARTVCCGWSTNLDLEPPSHCRGKGVAASVCTGGGAQPI